MAAQPQTENWRALANAQFPGYNIQGSGPFAVFDYVTNTMRLYQFEIEATFTGRKVQRIQIPQKRAFRRKFDAED
jgi:hypothetical protein